MGRKYYSGYGSGGYTSGYNYSKSNSYYNSQRRQIGYYGDSYYGSDTYYKPKTTWSWNDWDSGGLKEDAGDLFIREPESYFTPTKFELRYRLREDQLSDAQELCRFFYYRMVDDKNYIAERFLDESKLNKKQLEELIVKKQVYEKLWDEAIPGTSPKEKAIYILTQATGAKGKGKAKITELDESTIAKIKICNDDYWDPIYNNIIDDVDNKSMDKLSLLRKISLIRNFGSKFKIEKDIDEKVVANSKLYARKMMRDYSQLYNVDLYQRLFPNYKHKLATKDLFVNVPVDKTEHKQKVIMLVDGSGSMCTLFKQEWVTAILLERLKHAIQEECEIYFSFFLRRTSEFKFHHIYNKETALRFWREGFNTRPNGGDTALGCVVEEINKQISNGYIGSNKEIPVKFTHDDRPEILAIGDGQDSVKASSFKYKTNCISLLQDNDEVRNLCKENNGIHVFIDEYERVNIRE